MQVLDAAATTRALPLDRLVPALRQMFVGGCEVPDRQVLEIGTPGAAPVTSLVMPAWVPGRYYGLKCINIAPGNAQRALPALHASYLLHDAGTGVPLALIDGDVLTARRTAAASALAAGWLAREDARHLLVVGAGRVAQLLPEAHAVLRPIERVSVWARSQDRAQALARACAARGFDARAVTDLASAVRSADIVSCATLATEPLVQGRWLQPGSHLDLIGSFTPSMREADDDCLRAAALYVDTDEALRKSGDLAGPLQRGVIAAADVCGSLQDLARGRVTGRRTPLQRTVFKSVGTALEDLAAAVLAYETLREAAA
jgi:ornithine cyclodeaminase